MFFCRVYPHRNHKTITWQNLMRQLYNLFFLWTSRKYKCLAFFKYTGIKFQFTKAFCICLKLSIIRFYITIKPKYITGVIISYIFIRKFVKFINRKRLWIEIPLCYLASASYDKISLFFSFYTLGDNIQL